MKPRALVSSLVGLLLAGPAIAAENTARDWAAGCLSCHSGSGTVLPTLHGQPRDALISKLRAFREGTQPGTVMPQLARGYSDAQLEAIAGWFANAKVAP